YTSDSMSFAKSLFSSPEKEKENKYIDNPPIEFLKNETLKFYDSENDYYHSESLFQNTDKQHEDEKNLSRQEPDSEELDSSIDFSDDLQAYNSNYQMKYIPDKKDEFPRKESYLLFYFQYTGMFQENDPEKLEKIKHDALWKTGHFEQLLNIRSCLNWRIHHCTKIKEMEKNPPMKKLAGSAEIRRDGKKLDQSIQELEKNDKIMLPAVMQHKYQDTACGCWSVSLQLLLAYRGVDIDQNTIRAYQPNEKEITDVDFKDKENFWKDAAQEITCYSGLVNRICPNTAVNVVSIFESREYNLYDHKAQLRLALETAFLKHNSPVSLCIGGNHYITVVGMEGEKIFYKESLKNHHEHDGDPNTTFVETFDGLLKKENKSQLPIQLIWLQDLHPKLDGSPVELDVKGKDASSKYYNGVLTNTQAVPYSDDMRMCRTTLERQATNSKGHAKNIKWDVVLPARLSYTKKGSSYNMDVLQDYVSELKESLLQGEKLNALREAGEQLLNSDKAVDYKALHGLASCYQEAIKEVQQRISLAAEGEKQSYVELQKKLQEQASELRLTLMNSLQDEYQLKLGDDDVCWKLRREEGYKEIEEGFAGMLYIDSAGKFALDDPNWVKALDLNVYRDGVKQLKESKAFCSTMKKMDVTYLRAGLSNTFRDNQWVPEFPLPCDRPEKKIRCQLRMGDLEEFTKRYNECYEKIKSKEGKLDFVPGGGSKSVIQFNLKGKSNS
ncbi:MAG: hypothetical protein Q4B50_05960, partial [Bacillota bacterium]|nr:hypothetical protein [Bacillota bacterium]